MASSTPNSQSHSGSSRKLSKFRGHKQGVAPTLADGIVDGHGGTQLNLGWMLRHVRKGLGLVLRHPVKLLAFAARHPKKFFRLSASAARSPKSKKKDPPLVTTVYRQEVMTLLNKMDVEFFEVTSPGRIGHLAGEVDLWLKERAFHAAADKKNVLIMDQGVAANPHFFLYCKQRFDHVISTETWEWLLQSVPEVECLHRIKWDYFHAYDESAECYSIYAAWRNRGPLFELTEEDRGHLTDVLRQWGMGEKDWFVCFHNRERGYSPADDEQHDYRNAKIEDYIPAIQEVVRQGGWVVRMGDPAMTPLPAMHRVIDYAHSQQRSPRLDVELSAAARCMIGCSSGLPIMASAFGVPVVMANLVPISIQALTQNDLGMPKLYYSEKAGRLLHFNEVFSDPMSNFRFTNLYRENQLRLVDNEPEDLLEVTREMLERLGGKCEYTEDDERLQRLYTGFFRRGHYGAESAARTSRAFLRKHRMLIETTAASL